jgi:hypothetical protein
MIHIPVWMEHISVWMKKMAKKIECISWDCQRGDEALYEIIRAVKIIGQPVFIVPNPKCGDMDTYGVIISNEILTDEEIKELQ